MNEDTRFLVGLIGGILLLLVSIMAIAAWADSVSCHAKYADSGLQTRWSMMGGCRVNVPGQGWIPSGNYRVI
jgi:hypothetical protein